MLEALKSTKRQKIGLLHVQLLGKLLHVRRADHRTSAQKGYCTCASTNAAMAPMQHLLLGFIALAVHISLISAQNCTLGDYCPPINCSAPALLELPCASGFNCPQDGLPRLCPARYYCPDGVQILRCPKDSYCPSGSVKPIGASLRCSLHSHSP